MKFSLKFFLATSLLVFASSCKNEIKEESQVSADPQNQEESQAHQPVEIALETQNEGEESTAIESIKVEPNDTLITSSNASSNYASWIGKTLHAKDQNLFEKWTEDLSRDPDEKRLRETQLVHQLRAEVLTWSLSEADLEPITSEDEPTRVEIPFFGDETLVVVAEKIRQFGEEAINFQGYLENDPESKVVFNLSSLETVGLIEGPESLYYYDTYEDTVLLREAEPGSQYADSNCECEFHQAAQE